MTDVADDRPPSLHQRILSEIGDRILSGAWPPGTRIPSEHELTLHYGCSRMTVSKALTELAKSGLIERRRRAGSTVRRPQTQSALLEIRDIRAEVEALGLPYRHEVTRRSVRSWRASDGERFEGRPGAPLLQVDCLHVAGGRPFCMEARLIGLDAVPDARGETFAELSPGAWLVARVPWTTAEHRIMAAAATGSTARALAVEEGTACLVVERRTWAGEQQVTFARFTYPGGAHQLVARFSPSQG
jgi:GntR family histidine utilization transcriptional repressor